MFRGLPGDRQRRFVAAVWNARGWEATVAGDVVRVTRDGTTQRIRVVRPRWFGTPDFTGADIAVVLSDRERTSVASASLDVEIVTPADLRDQLLYGMDRGVAADIFEAHFDRPLSAPQQGPGPKAGGLKASGGPVSKYVGWVRLSSHDKSVTVRSPPTTIVLLAVVGLLLGFTVVDPSILSLGGNSNAAGVAITGTFTPEAPGAIGGDGEEAAVAYPAGVDERGVQNASKLGDAHLSQTLNRRYAFSFDFGGPAAAPDFGDWEVVQWDLVVEHRSAFHVDAEFNASDDWRSIGVYANGVRDYRIYRTPDGTRTTEMPVAASDADSYAHFASVVVERYLNTTESTIQCVDVEGGTCERYRVVATGEPRALTADLDESASIRHYQAVAFVTPDGFVTSLVVRYDLDTDGLPKAVDLRFNYQEYGTARIQEPSWVDAIREEQGAHTPGANVTSTRTTTVG